MEATIGIRDSKLLLTMKAPVAMITPPASAKWLARATITETACTTSSFEKSP